MVAEENFDRLIPPFDILVTTKEYGCWYDKYTETTKISTKQEATHCHVNPVCILAKNSEFQALLLKIGKGCSIVTRTFLSSL